MCELVSGKYSSTGSYPDRILRYGGRTTKDEIIRVIPSRPPPLSDATAKELTSAVDSLRDQIAVMIADTTPSRLIESVESLIATRADVELRDPVREFVLDMFTEDDDEVVGEEGELTIIPIVAAQIAAEQL